MSNDSTDTIGSAPFTDLCTFGERSDGRYDATIAEFWTIGPKVHGGVMLAVCASAARQKVREADSEPMRAMQPLSVAVDYLGAPNPGAVILDVNLRKTGKQIWKTKVEYPAETPRIVCCGIINRGAALYDGKLFRTTLDANVIALDAKTGKELWREKAADIKEGYSMTVAPLVAGQRPDRLPLSMAQARMWFINQFEPGTATYNIPALLRLRGKLDLVALRRAVEDVVARHEVLRTTFPAVDGTPVQVIHPAHRVAAELDWAVVSDEQALADAVSTGFNVTESLPLRVRVAPVGPDEHIVALVAHHIAADGESMRPLVADLVTAYLARSADAAPEFVPLAVQFADYSIWQHQVLGDPADPESVVGRQLAHWVAELAGLPDVIDLPTDRPRPRIATHRGARMQVAIPAEIADRIAATAAERGVTSFMVVHAALSVLLARLSGSADIAVATPVAGRGHAVLDPLVGMFVNTLILRSEVDLAESFVDLLDRIRVTDLDAFTHADVPFETIVDALDPVRSEAFAPLAQVMLSMEAGAVEDPTVRVDELEVEPVEVPSVPAQLDLALTVTTAPSGDDWQCSIVYATDLFDDGTISTFADRYLALLAGLTAAPADAVGDTTLISPAETAAVLSAATGPTTEPIVDYLTQFSGIQPDDLDPKRTQRTLVSHKTAYKKLRMRTAEISILVHSFSLMNAFVITGKSHYFSQLLSFSKNSREIRVQNSYSLPGSCHQ